MFVQFLQLEEGISRDMIDHRFKIIRSSRDGKRAVQIYLKCLPLAAFDKLCLTNMVNLPFFSVSTSPSACGSRLALPGAMEDLEAGAHWIAV